jgi:glycosyltransferase involved in cell wall biosynthesis
MNCPSLNDLPISPCKTGWPWTEETPPLPPTMPDGSPWPKISIVTPSFNQGQFIEETIRSVLLQGYPNLEYIIIDGGSTDGSVEIIKKYEPWLAYWVSEKDNGQSEAINKGFKKAHGEIIAWLNSDDLLMPRAIQTAAQYFLNNPQVDLLYGSARILGDGERELGTWRSRDFDFRALLYEDFICQPASFFRSRAFTMVGGLRTDLHYAFDYDLWLRIAVDHAIRRVEPILGCDRKQRNAKTMVSTDRLVAERIKVVLDFFKSNKLPPDFVELQPHVMAVHYLRAALDFLALQKIDEMLFYFRESHLADPTFNPSNVDWAKWVLIHVSRDSATNSDAFITNAQLASKPIFGDYFQSWEIMRKRARLISLTRGNLRLPYFSILREIIIAFLTDAGWSLNREIIPDLVRLIIGSEFSILMVKIKRNLSKVEL